MKNFFKRFIILFTEFCNRTLACYTVKITEEFLTLWYNEYYYADHRWSFWKCAEIKIIRLHKCRLQYYKTDQTCSHNWDNIEICSAQQVRTDRELLYTKSWYFETCVSWCACWVLSSHKLLY